MSAPALPELVEGPDLHEPRLLLIDYNPHARRLVLRIETASGADTAARRVRTLVFDSLVGLHCDPADALARPEMDGPFELQRLDAKMRKSGEAEVNLVFRRLGQTQAVSFLALDARWLD